MTSQAAFPWQSRGQMPPRHRETAKTLYKSTTVVARTSSTATSTAGRNGRERPAAFHPSLWTAFLHCIVRCAVFPAAGLHVSQCTGYFGIKGRSAKN